MKKRKTLSTGGGAVVPPSSKKARKSDPPPVSPPPTKTTTIATANAFPFPERRVIKKTSSSKVKKTTNSTTTTTSSRKEEENKDNAIIISDNSVAVSTEKSVVVAKNATGSSAGGGGDELDSFAVETQKTVKPLTEEERHEKKKKKRKKMQQRLKEDKSWVNIQYDSLPAQQSFFWLKLAESLKKEITSLELADAISENSFIRPSGEYWGLSQLPVFIKEQIPDIKLITPSKRQPIVFVVTRSAIRAIDIFKSLCSLGSMIRVGQFFAKHKTLKEQQDILGKTHFHVIVGTPNRIKTLIESSSLSTAMCKLVVIDMSVDVKSFSVLDLNDTKVDFFHLYHKYLHSQIKQEKTKIVLF